jgi:hypothetical protein
MSMDPQVLLGSVVIGAVSAAIVGGLFATVSQAIARRQERLAMAVELAKVMHEHQRVSVEAIKAVGQPAEIQTWHPVYEIPRLLRIVDALQRRNFKTATAEYEKLAKASEFRHLE